jgi:hypothetical protein
LTKLEGTVSGSYLRTVRAPDIKGMGIAEWKVSIDDEKMSRTLEERLDLLTTYREML